MHPSTLEDLVKRRLGVSLPPSYLLMLQHHHHRLAEDPLTQESGIPGLGNIDFVIGTTLSFRKVFKDMPKQVIIIGHAGTRTIAKINEKIDIYLGLDTETEKIVYIDALGHQQQGPEHFRHWMADRLASMLAKDPSKRVLLVIGFTSRYEADRCRQVLLELHRSHTLNIEDVVLLELDRNHRLHLYHGYGSLTKNLAAGGLSGLILGSLLLHPIVGLVVGTAAGAVVSPSPFHFRSLGLDDDFIRELASLIQPDTATVFILTAGHHPHEALDKIKPCKGKILATSLSPPEDPNWKTDSTTKDQISP